MAVPMPSAGPPKYSATSAEMTASDAAIRNPVSRYGSAVGRVSRRNVWPARGAGRPQQVAVHRTRLPQPAEHVDEHRHERGDRGDRDASELAGRPEHRVQDGRDRHDRDDGDRGDQRARACRRWDAHAAARPAERMPKSDPASRPSRALVAVISMSSPMMSPCLVTTRSRWRSGWAAPRCGVQHVDDEQPERDDDHARRRRAPRTSPRRDSAAVIARSPSRRACRAGPRARP